jgi:hypothetical protein
LKDKWRNVEKVPANKLSIHDMLPPLDVASSTINERASAGNGPAMAQTHRLFWGSYRIACKFTVFARPHWDLIRESFTMKGIIISKRGIIISKKWLNMKIRWKCRLAVEKMLLRVKKFNYFETLAGTHFEMPSWMCLNINTKTLNFTFFKIRYLKKTKTQFFIARQDEQNDTNLIIVLGYWNENPDSG